MRGAATTYETPSDTELRVTRVFDARREAVWEAMTSPEHLPKWMLGPPGWSMPVCEADVRAGGQWHYVWRKTEGEEMEMRGRYLEVDPPSRYSCTESWGPDWPETVNTVELSEEDGRTTMTLTVTYPSAQARDTAMATGMKDGMEASYARLDEVLAA